MIPNLNYYSAYKTTTDETTNDFLFFGTEMLVSVVITIIGFVVYLRRRPEESRMTSLPQNIFYLSRALGLFMAGILYFSAYAVGNSDVADYCKNIGLCIY